MLESILPATQELADDLGCLVFASPVTHVYNPLQYAWAAHELYLKRYARSPKRVLLLGMNPGPFGMVQTGVPFGEVQAVKSWLRLEAVVKAPAGQHPRRPIQGFACPRCEISGQRLWGLFAQRFGTAESFFKEHLVVNYCPLAFLEESGRNRTPDKLPAGERQRLFTRCDDYLRLLVRIYRPEWVVGVGDFAARRAQEALAPAQVKVGRILHPSPASPRANRNWAGEATQQLIELGIWS